MSRDGYTNDEWDRLLAILPDVLDTGVSLELLMCRLRTRTTLYDASAVRQVVHGYRKHLDVEWDHQGLNPKLRELSHSSYRLPVEAVGSPEARPAGQKRSSRAVCDGRPHTAGGDADVLGGNRGRRAYTRASAELER